MAQLLTQQRGLLACSIVLLIAESNVCEGLRHGLLSAHLCCLSLIGLSCAALLAPLKRDALLYFEALMGLFCTILMGALVLPLDQASSLLQQACVLVQLVSGSAFIGWAMVMPTRGLLPIKAAHSCAIVLHSLQCNSTPLLLARSLSFCIAQLLLISGLKQQAKKEAASTKQQQPGNEQPSDTSRGPATDPSSPQPKQQLSLNAADPASFRPNKKSPQSRPSMLNPPADQPERSELKWDALSGITACKNSADVGKSWISSPCCVNGESCMATPFCHGCSPRQDKLQPGGKERSTSIMGGQSSSSGGGSSAGFGVSLETWCSSVTLDTSMNLSQISGPNPWSQSQPMPLCSFSQSPMSSNTMGPTCLDSTPSVQTIDTAMGDGHAHGHHHNHHKWSLPNGSSDLPSRTSNLDGMSSQGTPAHHNGKPGSMIAAFVTQNRQLLTAGSLAAIQHVGGITGAHLRQIWLKRRYSSAFVSEQDVNSTCMPAAYENASTSEQLPQPIPVAVPPTRPFSTSAACVADNSSPVLAPDMLGFLDSARPKLSVADSIPSQAAISSNDTPEQCLVARRIPTAALAAAITSQSSRTTAVAEPRLMIDDSASVLGGHSRVGGGPDWQQLLGEFRTALADCSQEPRQAGSTGNQAGGVPKHSSMDADDVCVEDCYEYLSPLGNHQQVSIKIRTAHTVKEVAPNSMQRLQQLMDRHHQAADPLGRLSAMRPLITSMSVRQGCVQIVLETVQPHGPMLDPVPAGDGGGAAGPGDAGGAAGGEQADMNAWIRAGPIEDEEDKPVPLWKLAGDVEIKPADNKICARCPETEQLEQLAVEVVEALGLDTSKLQDKDRVDVQVKGMMCTATWDAATGSWSAKSLCLNGCCDPAAGDILSTRFVCEPQALNAPSRSDSRSDATGQAGASCLPYMAQETDKPSLVRHRDSQSPNTSGSHAPPSASSVTCSSIGTIMLRCSISLPVNSGVDGFEPVANGSHGPVLPETGHAPNVHVLIQVNGSYLKSEITHLTITPDMSGRQSQGMQVAHVLVKTALGSSLSSLPSAGTLASGSQVLCGKVELWHGAWVLDVATILIPPEAVRVSLPRFGQPTSQSSPLPLPVPLHPQLDLNLCIPNYLSGGAISGSSNEGLEDSAPRPCRRRQGQQSLMSWLSGVHTSDSSAKLKGMYNTDVSKPHMKQDVQVPGGIRLPIVAGLSVPTTPQHAQQAAGLFTDSRGPGRDAGGWGDQDVTGKAAFMADLSTWMSMLQDSQQQLCLEASKCSMTLMQMSPSLIAYAAVLGKSLLRYAVRHAMRDVAGYLFVSICSPAGQRLMCSTSDDTCAPNTATDAARAPAAGTAAASVGQAQIERVLTPTDAAELARLASRSGDSQMVMDLINWFSPMISVPGADQSETQPAQRWPSIPEDLSCEQPEHGTGVDHAAGPATPSSKRQRVGESDNFLCSESSSPRYAWARSNSAFSSRSGRQLCGDGSTDTAGSGGRRQAWFSFLASSLQYFPEPELEQAYCLYRANRALPMQLWWSLAVSVGASGLLLHEAYDLNQPCVRQRLVNAGACFVLGLVPALLSSFISLLSLYSPQKQAWRLKLELVAVLLSSCHQTYRAAFGIPGLWTSQQVIKVVTQMKRLHMDILVMPVCSCMAEQTRARLSLLCQLFATAGLTGTLIACGMGGWEALSRGLAVSVISLVYSLVLDAHMRAAFLQSLRSAGDSVPTDTVMDQHCHVARADSGTKIKAE